VTDPGDLAELENPYPGFSEDRRRMIEALSLLGMDPYEEWRTTFTGLSKSSLMGLDEIEIIKRTMLVFMRWIEEHFDGLV
jgi:hypothetical protein